MNGKVIAGIAIIALLLYWATRPSTTSSPSPEQVNVPAIAPDPVVPTAPRRPDSTKRTFAGHACSGDCSGHEAGYAWAEEHGIDDEEACDTAGEHSNSPSFAEGCKAYVNGDSDDSDQEKNDDPDGANIIFRPPMHLSLQSLTA